MASKAAARPAEWPAGSWSSARAWRRPGATAGAWCLGVIRLHLPGRPVTLGGWLRGFDSAPSAEHYNGTSWSQVSIPVIVAQASGSPQAGDWVTGTVAAQPGRVEILHWSKGAWRNAALPKISVPKGDQMLPGLIAANTTADIWATIGVGPVSGHGPVPTVLLHWNGKAWSKALVPNQGNLAGLYGLASDGHGGAWVVWNTSDKRGLPTGVLIYHYSAGHWTRVPAPAKLGSGAQFTANLELIPGTRSVLAGSWGSILKYGP